MHGDAGGEAGTPPFGAAGDRSLRAYDKATGAIIWQMELPAGATGGMAMYRFRGKQYIVLPIGTRGQPSEIIALSLP